MASTSIPRTMKGVLVEQTGGPEVLQYRTDLPVPEPREGEVLVKNAYIGVNYIDTYYRTGLYSSPKPEILGREAEGTIVAVGPGETYSLKVGDRVVWMGASGYAEYSAVPALRTVKIPAQMPPTHAVAALIQGLTALSLVRESYPVRRGDWVLVHAAAGGCGLWLCQLLRAIGARTIGTASTAEKRALAERNGAEFTIDSSAQDFVEQVMRLTDGEGVIAVFDGVGKDTFDADLEVVARKGTVVSFGNASGDVLPFSIRRLAPKNIKLLRPQLYSYIHTRDEFTRYTNDLFHFLSKGVPHHPVVVHIHHVYPLDQVAVAHQDLEGRKTTGKLLLKP